MKRFCLILCFVLFAVVSYAQKVPTIVMDGGVEEKSTDLDARSYYPKYDINDRLCSLVKVTIINWPKNPLTLEVGGLGVVDRVEKRELGEIWFYVPAQVKNLRFKCADYITPEPIPVSFKEGTVYTIRLVADTVVETITKVALSSNYLKLGISVPNCKVSLGKTTGYELLSTYSKSGNFAERLEYGIYYYKVEHPDYETFYGVVELGAATPKQLVTLTPAFGYLDIYTSPAGATAYINGKVVGTTPCSVNDPLPKGVVEVFLDMDDYYTVTKEVTIVGDGSRQSINEVLRPRYATVTLTCPDSEAEIWMDNEFMGKGSWRGRLGSMTKHFVETRRVGYYPQSVYINVEDGADMVQTLPAPKAIYGILDVTTEPFECQIAINGEVVGETPYINQLLVGDYEVALSKEGYVDEVFTATIAYNETLTIHKELRAQVVPEPEPTPETEPEPTPELESEPEPEPTPEPEPEPTPEPTPEIESGQTLEGESVAEGAVTEGDVTEGESEEEIPEEPEVVEEPVYGKVDIMPTFMGGGINEFRTWVKRKYRYPYEASSYAIEGKLVIRFVVEKDGSIGDVRFLQSPHESFEKEALRVFRDAPYWTPGYHQGELARVQFVLPIDFRLY